MAASARERALALADAARAGDRRALARLLTAVENHSELAEHAMRDLYPRAGGAHLVGITGPPGAGKSTLVASLIAALREAGVARVFGPGTTIGEVATYLRENARSRDQG